MNVVLTNDEFLNYLDKPDRTKLRFYTLLYNIENTRSDYIFFFLKKRKAKKHVKMLMKQFEYTKTMARTSVSNAEKLSFVIHYDLLTIIKFREGIRSNCITIDDWTIDFHNYG